VCTVYALLISVFTNPLLSSPLLLLPFSLLFPSSKTTKQDIGTNRVRANHFDAAIDYCEEQMDLQKANAPIEIQEDVEDETYQV